MVRGWKAQSLLVHNHLTRPASKARAEGIMPLYASLALKIAGAAARVAGMAKKRWRDGDATRMNLIEIRLVRRLIDQAFEDLEREMLTRQDSRPAETNPSKAGETAKSYGLLGLTALALMEEAGELAEPLAKVAAGASDLPTIRRSIEDEAADLRTWLHLVDNTIGIDPVGTTQAKWDRSSAKLGPAVDEALSPQKLDQSSATASLVALARKARI
jgi:NTP pyrophosphatase (non-canonical NTP hydrolase)